MRIITRRAIKESWIKYPQAKESLAVWEERIECTTFRNHEELNTVFRGADYIPNNNFRHLTVFNIKGNEFRLIVDIFFNTNHIYVKWFGKHSAYDRIDFHSFSNGSFILC